MSRTASILLLLAALALVSVGTQFVVLPQARENQQEELTKSLVVAGRLLQELNVTDEGQLVWRLTELSSRPALRALLEEKPAEPGRLAEWLDKLRNELTGMNTTLREVLPVKDFFILNANGLGLVRLGEKHWTGVVPSDNPKVREVVQLAGAGRREARLVEDGTGLLRVVAVPVIVADGVSAILLATFLLDDARAKAQSSELNLDHELAYVTAKGITSGSLSDKGRKALEEFLKQNAVQVTKLLEGKTMAPRVAETSAGRFLVAGLPMKVRGGKNLCGLVVLREIDSHLKRFAELSLVLVLVAGGGFLILTIVTLLFGGRMARALRRLQTEAIEIQGGEGKKRFQEQGPAPVRALAGILNQLFPQQPEPAKEAAPTPDLQEVDAREPETVVEEGEAGAGQPEAGAEAKSLDYGSDERTVEDQASSEQEERKSVNELEDELTQLRDLPESGGEQAPEAKAEPSGIGDEDKTPKPGAPEPETAEGPEAPVAEQGSEQQTSRPAADAGHPGVLQTPLQQTAPKETDQNEEEYYRGVFAEFLKAKQDLGEKVEKLDFERFVKKLKSQEEALKAKHACRAVRFQVMIKNNQVSLRPRIIR